jgi:hypothetical protein
MNVLVYHDVTYYYHQQQLLILIIVSYWKSYQAMILEYLKGKEVVLAEDGRHESILHHILLNC